MDDSKIRVLYIDDEPELLEICKLYLEKNGKLLVDIESSSRNALNLIKEHQYEAIISDYQMPEMNGIELLTSIRGEGNKIPYILFTGKGREEVVIQALNAGADSYVQKGGIPQAQFAELEHRIKTIVFRSRAERSLYETNIQLQEASSRYEALIAASNTGAWEFNSLTGFLWCSPEYFSILGRNIKDFDLSGRRNIQETWVDLLHPDDRERAVQFFANYLRRSDGMYEQYFRLQRNDGGWAWVLSRGKTLRDEDGKPTAITVGTHIDVTTEKMAEEAVRNSEERFRTLVTNLPDPIVILSFDGKIRFMNAVTRHLLGIDDSVDYLDVEIKDFLKPDSMVRAISDLERVNRGEEPFMASYEIVAINGSQIWVEAIGRKISWMGESCDLVSMRDVTNQKKIESDLRQANAYNRGLFEASLDGLVTIRPDGLVHDVNRTMVSFTGISKEHLIGTDFSNYFTEPEKAKEGYMSVYQNKEVRDYYLDLLNVNGDSIPVLLHASLYNDEGGNALGILAAVKDISEQMDMEEDLRKMARAAECSPACVVITDMDGNIEWVNPKFTDLTGYSLEEVKGQNPRILKSGEKSKEDYQLLWETITSGNIWHGEFHNKTKNGALYWESASIAPIFDKDRKMTHFIAIKEDITERKHAEERLRKNEKELHELIYHLHAGVVMHGPNTEILMANEQASLLLGLTIEQMMGKTAVDPAWCFIHEDGSRVPIEEYPVAKVFATGSSLKNAEFGIFRPDTKDLIWVLANAYPEFDSDGKIRRVVVTFIDITERKTVEDALTESMGKYKVLFDSLPIGITISDSSGKITESNEEAENLLGLSKDEQIEKHIDGKEWRIVRPDGSKMPFEEFASVIAMKENRRVDNVEMGIVKGNGETTWINVVASPIPTKEHGIVIAYSDISGQKRMNGALQEANRKLSLLSSITRHDISNQMMILEGNLGMLEEDDLGDAGTEHLQKAIGAAKRISTMVQFTKEYENIGLNQAIWHDINEVITRTSLTIPLEGVQVVNNIPPGTQVFADPMLFKVFLNLIQNAVRHGGKTTSVLFYIEESGGQHSIVCEDDGKGIPIESKGEIFSRGFEKEHGLGLPLSREILAITKISIKEVGEPGKGARFILTIPRDGFRAVN